MKHTIMAMRFFSISSQIITGILLLFIAQNATGNDALPNDNKHLITAGPSWDRFTNKDGSGLYHDIIKLVFSDFTIEHQYVPTVQANSMVEIGRADIKMCETKEIPPLLLADHPMYENDFFALFLKRRFEPWKGPSMLEDKNLVWRAGYYSDVDFSFPVQFTEVRKGESALKMIILERADFYIDDMTLINQSIKEAGEANNRSKFMVEKAGTRKYFPVFANSPRGQMLKKHFEKELARLYQEGKLQPIYDHWGFQTPDFSFAK